jgi:signal transduction histidine kinase/CheY-like chemotaxis protein
MATADAFPFPTLNAPVRFGVAIASVLIVFLIDRGLDYLIDDGALFLLLGMAVMASAWFAGTGPALAATVAGALLGAADQSGADSSAGYTRLALFVVQGLVLTAIISELRRARRIAEQRAGQAQAATREAESASRMKDEFLATISHELRTPLNAMLGWVHLLRTGKLDSQTSVRGLESIERNARLQSQLMGNLLDISKALTGRLQVESHPVPLGEVARQAMTSANPAALARAVNIVSDIADEPVAVLGDWSRLRQVVWHLVANALKFTPRGGSIGVMVHAEGHDAVLKVFDSGPGIDPEFLPRIFERFTQEDGSPTRTAGGLGVGLSLVRELVELHGGEIAAANRTDGSGAVFTASFPLQSVSILAAAPVQPSTPASVESAPLDGLRVLVLDKDGEGRELVQTVLQQRGAAVRVTESVADALESLESWRPDVLVSDNGSSDHNSYSLFGKVPSLESERGGRIPALALTNFARTDQHVRCLLAAALSDLPKPVEPALLTAEIARLTGRERRRAAR